MAPPGRMDEPLRSRLRPATRHSGLTSPDTVTAPAQAPPATSPDPARNTRTSRRKAKRQQEHAQPADSRSHYGEPCRNDHPHSRGGSRLSLRWFEPNTCHQPEAQVRDALASLSRLRGMQPDATGGRCLSLVVGYTWDGRPIWRLSGLVRLRSAAPGPVAWDGIRHPAGRRLSVCWRCPRRRRGTWRRRGAGLRRCARPARPPGAAGPRRPARGTRLRAAGRRAARPRVRRPGRESGPGSALPPIRR